MFLFCTNVNKDFENSSESTSLITFSKRKLAYTQTCIPAHACAHISFKGKTYFSKFQEQCTWE